MIACASIPITSKMPDIFIPRMKPRPTLVFDTYWKFAQERQMVFFNRLKNELPPWTKDPILANYKFTNAYRAADRVSQYLISNVIYSKIRSSKDTLFRILLFKIFNKIETWEYLEKHIGEITYDKFDYILFSNLLFELKRHGKSIYSGAYIMASGKSFYKKEMKHENHLLLIKDIMEGPLLEEIPKFTNMHQLYDALLKFPTIGKFLAYQYAIDINYSPLCNFSEMEFVKAGPGAIDGITKCFKSGGEYSYEDIIHWVTESQEKEFERLDIKFQSLWGRDLQLIDCQNLFCEIDKYSRVAHPEYLGKSERTRIKRKFKPTSLKSINYFFPPKWNINNLISS